MSTSKSTKADRQSPSAPPALGGSAAARSRRPSDMDLMLYFDGELEDSRRAEIEAYLDSDAGARSKMSGLRVTSEVVRAQALSSARGGDIADLVMAKIEAGAVVPPASNGASVEPAELVKTAKVRPTKAANDNSRGIFTLAAIAVAAAAAMMVWGRTGSEPVHSADNTPKIAEVAPTLEQAPPAPAPAPQVEASDTDVEHGVEVAAVDFGSHMGTIFYVPTGAAASNAMTTVVWVDDEAGEK